MLADLHSTLIKYKAYGQGADLKPAYEFTFHSD